MVRFLCRVLSGLEAEVAPQGVIGSRGKDLTQEGESLACKGDVGIESTNRKIDS